MFRITKRENAEVIGIVEHPRYIVYDKASNSFFRAFGKDDADGIAVRGQVYNFGNNEKLKGYPFADIAEVDGAALIATLQAEKNQLQVELTETQAALIEAYETADNDITATQLALTEIYEKLEV